MRRKKTGTSIEEIVGDYSMAGARRLDAPGNLRAGYAVKGSRQDHLEASPSALLPKVVVVYVRKNDKVLAVSRHGSASDLNMPAGHVEPGEDPRDAAVRELWEETGLKADEIYPVCSKVRGGYLVTAYRVPAFHGNLRPSQEGRPSWETHSALTASTFGDFFTEMLRYLGENAQK